MFSGRYGPGHLRETACEEAKLPNVLLGLAWLSPLRTPPTLCRAQRRKEGVGAAFAWLHLLGSDLSSWEEAQRMPEAPGSGCPTEVAAEVAPGTHAGPIKGFLDLCPGHSQPPLYMFSLSQWHLVIPLALTTMLRIICAQICIL